MKRNVVGLVLFLSAAGCGSSGGNPLSLLQQCGAGAFLQFVSVMERMGDVITVIQNQQVQGGLPEGVSVTPGAAENEWDFTIALDLDASGDNETTITGRVLFSANPVDGIEATDTAAITINQAATSTAPAMSANVDLTFQSSRIFDVLGDARVTDLLNCQVDLTFRPTDPLNMEFLGFPTAERQLAVAIADIADISGSTLLNIVLGGDTLDAVLVLDQVGDNASLTFQAFNSVQIEDDDAPIVIGGSAFEELATCAVVQLFGALGVGGTVESVLDALGDGSTEIEGGSFTITPISGLTFDIVVNVTQDGQDVTSTMRVTFSADPNVAPFVGTATVSSWSLRVRRSQLVGNLGALLPEFDANNVGATILTFIDDDPFTELASTTGSGRVTTVDGSCTATSTATNFSADNDEGRIAVVGSSDGIPVRFTVTDREIIFEGVEVILATIGGVPVPGNLLTGLFDLLFEFDNE